MSYASTILADSPTAYYRLNGTTATDSSTASLAAGTIGGTVTTSQPGPLRAEIATSYSMLFDGSTGYITLPSGLDISAYSAYSIECWFLLSTPTGHSGRIISSSHTDSDKKGFQLTTNASGAGGLYDLGNGTTEYNIYYGQAVAPDWHHLVALWTGTTIKLYIDNQPRGSSATTGTMASSGNPITIGKLAGASIDYCPMYLAEVAIYNVALTTTQISTHFKAGRTATMSQQGQATYKTQTGLNVRARSTFKSQAILNVRARTTAKTRAILCTGSRSTAKSRVTLNVRARSSFKSKIGLGLNARATNRLLLILRTVGYAKYKTQAKLTVASRSKLYSRARIQAATRAVFKIRTASISEKPLTLAFKTYPRYTLAFRSLTMVEPNSTITSTATLTDNTLALVTSVTSITATVLFPDGTTSTPPVINSGSGVYQIQYNTKTPGLIKEDWQVIGTDGAIAECKNSIAVSY